MQKITLGEDCGKAEGDILGWRSSEQWSMKANNFIDISRMRIASGTIIILLGSLTNPRYGLRPGPQEYQIDFHKTGHRVRNFWYSTGGEIKWNT